MRNQLILPVFVPTLILSFCQGMLIPVLPIYASSFEAAYTLVGLVVASRGIGNLIGDVPAGILLGRIGQKRAMLAGLAVVSLSTLAMSWAHSVLELVVYGLAAGIGMALWNVSRHAYIAATTPVRQRGRSIAIFGGVGRIGTFAGPVVGGAIATAYGLGAPFVLYAAITGLTALFPLIFAEQAARGAPIHRGGVRGHALHLTSLLRAHGQVLSVAGAGQICAQMIRSGRTIIVPLYGADVLGLDVQAIGWVVSLSSAIDMAMFYPAGMLMDHRGRKYAYVPSFLIQGLGMALIPFTAGYYGFLAANLVIGFGNGLGSGTMMTLGADLAPSDSMGEFLGVWRLIGDAGSTGGPIVVGTVADALGLAAASFVLAGAGFAAALILGLFVPETLHSARQAAKVEVT